MIDTRHRGWSLPKPRKARRKTRARIAAGTALAAAAVFAHCIVPLI